MLGDNQGEGEGTRRRGMGRGLWEKVLGRVLHE